MSTINSANSKKMSKREIFFFAVVALLFGLFYIIGYQMGRKSVKVTTVEKVVYKERLIEKPVVRDSIVYKDRVVYKLKLDTVRETNTVYRIDTVQEEIPFEERLYGDSLYEAQVSGYLPRLDWVRVKQKEIIRETLVEKNPNWSLTIGPSVGYSYTPDGWKPSAGVSLTIGYSLKSF